MAKAKKGILKRGRGMPEPVEKTDTVPIEAPAAEEALTESAPTEKPVEQLPPKMESAVVPKAKVVPVADVGREVVVKPRKDIRRMRIGKGWYSFQKGVNQRVPAEAVSHLREKDII